MILKYFFCLILFVAYSFSFAQTQQVQIEAIQKFQEELNNEYKNPEKSPLSPEKLGLFEKHTFFEVNLDYCVKATLKKTPKAKPFLMQTTKGKTEYTKYAEAHFEIKNKKYKLNLYQALFLKNVKGYEDYLLLPFKDATNGLKTYKGGRYISLRTTDNNTIMIDFNQAYNPYCAYSDNYACPIVPKENTLPIEIPVGIQLN